jgi:hypothetical protein
MGQIRTCHTLNIASFLEYNPDRFLIPVRVVFWIALGYPDPESWK